MGAPMKTTVKELIEALQKFPPEADVLVGYDTDHIYFESEVVEVLPNEDGVIVILGSEATS